MWSMNWYIRHTQHQCALKMTILFAVGKSGWMVLKVNTKIYTPRYPLYYPYSSTLTTLTPYYYPLLLPSPNSLFPPNLIHEQCYLIEFRQRNGEGNGTPLQYSCLENPMDGGAWWAVVRGVTKNWARLSGFTFTVHFHALQKEMATHSSVLAWRIPGAGEPGGLPSMGSHRVGHNWSDLAVAAAGRRNVCPPKNIQWQIKPRSVSS